MIRAKFSLINETGAEYSLQNIGNGIFINASGFGMSRSASYTRLGTKWVRTSIKDDPVQITGDVLFVVNEYANGQTFLQFLRSAQSLKIKCDMNGNVKLKDVELVSCSPEMVGINALAYHLVFNPLSHWTNTTQERVTLEAEAVDEKEYEFDYSDSGYSYNDYSSAKLNVNNQSSFPCPFSVSFSGPIANPVITLKQNGETLAEVAITGTIISGESIEYSSIDDDAHCFKVSGGTKTNLVPDFDITKENFFKIPIGDSVIEISADSSITAPITVEIYRYYNVV